MMVVCVCAVRNSKALIRCDNYWKGGGVSGSNETLLCEMKPEGHFPADSGPHVLSSVCLSARSDYCELLMEPTSSFSSSSVYCTLYTLR